MHRGEAKSPIHRRLCTEKNSLGYWAMVLSKKSFKVKLFTQGKWDQKGCLDKSLFGQKVTLLCHLVKWFVQEVWHLTCAIKYFLKMITKWIVISVISK